MLEGFSQVVCTVLENVFSLLNNPLCEYLFILFTIVRHLGCFQLFYMGEGKGNPLQCSCLENPRDRGGLLSVGRTGSDMTEAT